MSKFFAAVKKNILAIKFGIGLIVSIGFMTLVAIPYFVVPSGSIIPLPPKLIELRLKSYQLECARAVIHQDGNDVTVTIKTAAGRNATIKRYGVAVNNGESEERYYSEPSVDLPNIGIIQVEDLPPGTYLFNLLAIEGAFDQLSICAQKAFIKVSANE